MKIDRTIYTTTDETPALHHRFEAKLLKPYSKRKTILDIGCWTGQFLSLIEDIAVCTGVEIDSKAVTFARKHRKGSYLVGSALSLPFQDEQFDVVTMWDVIEHLPKNTEEQALKEAVRVLKKNGIFALSTVTTHPLSILLDPAFFLLGHRHYSEKYLRDLLTRHNLRVVRVVYAGGIWSLFAHNFMLIQKHILRLNKTHDPFQYLVKREYRNGGFDQIHLIARKS